MEVDHDNDSKDHEVQLDGEKRPHAMPGHLRAME